MTIGEKILFSILWSIVWLISLLPFWALYVISDGLYLLICKALHYRRAVIEKNITSSFPEKTVKEREEIISRFYHYFCDIIVETIKLASASKKTIDDRMEYRHLDLLDEAVATGHGVTLYLAHYCNWEWVTTIGLHLPEKCFGGQVYHVLESKVMDKLMLRLRGRIGPVSIPMAEILRRMIKVKQEGKFPVIGFISDQSPIIYNTPYWVEFLDHNTPFISGTEKLSSKLHQTCVYLDITKVRRGHYVIDIQLMCKDASEMADGVLTEMYAESLERSIRCQPENWLWSHNRWKRRPEEYREAHPSPPQREGC